MADLFDAVLYQNNVINPCDSSEGQELKPVLICCQINVWTGKSSELTSACEESESLIRRNVVPPEMLKPFREIRNRAKKICCARGELYLNGYVMTEENARIVLVQLKALRDRFLDQRDRLFAAEYKKVLDDRQSGEVPLGCSVKAFAPTLSFVLDRLHFNFDAFSLVSFNQGSESSLIAFLKEFSLRLGSDAQSIQMMLSRDNFVSDIVLCHCRELAKRILAWRKYHPAMADVAFKLSDALSWASIRNGDRDVISKIELALSAVVALSLQFKTDEASTVAAEPDESSVQPPLPQASASLPYSDGCGSLSSSEDPPAQPQQMELSDITALKEGCESVPAPLPVESDDNDQKGAFACSVETLLNRDRGLCIG